MKKARILFYSILLLLLFACSNPNKNHYEEDSTNVKSIGIRRDTTSLIDTNVFGGKNSALKLISKKIDTIKPIRKYVQLPGPKRIISLNVSRALKLYHEFSDYELKLE